MAALEETCRLHFDALKTFQSTGVKRVDVYEYYNKLNPEFLVDIAKEYLAQVCVAARWCCVCAARHANNPFTSARPTRHPRKALPPRRPQRSSPLGHP